MHVVAEGRSYSVEGSVVRHHRPHLGERRVFERPLRRIEGHLEGSHVALVGQHVELDDGIDVRIIRRQPHGAARSRPHEGDHQHRQLGHRCIDVLEWQQLEVVDAVVADV